ncbi:MAG: AAA family ATPase [Candidatus Woesearchaeota archaeon]|jgi:predicted ATPase/ADP-ribose pyrophosphatase YjhB (NUDIX family)
MKRIVISGGPGVGKTELITHLGFMGYQTIPEVARLLFEEGVSIDNRTPLEFQQIVLERQYKLEQEITQGVVFQDRGIGDVLGYIDFFNLSLKDFLTPLSLSHYDHILILDPLPSEMYQGPPHRREDVETARKVHSAICNAYIRSHTPVIYIPYMLDPIRALYVLKELGIFPVVSMIVEEGDSITMLRREDEGPGQGKYTLLGGGVQVGESLHDAAIREAKEESGLDVEIISKFGEFPFFYQHRQVDHVYIGRRVGGELQRSEEGTPFRMRLSDIRYEDLAFPNLDIAILERYKETKAIP